MDLVYVCRPGRNEELRYSLRSFDQHVPHGKVWIIGDAPSWVRNVKLEKRPALATKYLTTTAHIRYACEHPKISDPFIMCNDDFFAMDKVSGIPTLHRGPVDALIRSYRAKSGDGPYVRGMIETRDLLRRLGCKNPLSYELHVPLVVHKAEMLKALDAAAESDIKVVHKRTLYGNLAAIGGEEIDDVKVYSMEQELPQGPWLSSCDKVFQYGVGNVVRWLFPNPGRYEQSS